MKNNNDYYVQQLLDMLVTDPVNQIDPIDRRYLRCSDNYISKLMEFEPCYLTATKVSECNRHFEGYIIGYGHFGVPKDYAITESQAKKLLINDLADLEIRLHSFLRGSLNLISTSRWESLLDIVYCHGIQALLLSKLFRLIELQYNNRGTMDLFHDIVAAFHAKEFAGKDRFLTRGVNERCKYRSLLWIKDTNY